MSAAGAIAAVVILIAAGAGAYFAYQGGYLQGLTEDLSLVKDVVEEQITGEPQFGETEEQLPEPEASEENMTFVSGGESVTYPTLFRNPRWNHMPIKVFLDVNSGEGVGGFEEVDADYVRDSLKVWEEKTGGIISFVEVGSSEDSEVQVSWFGSLSEIKGGRVVGEGGPTRAIDTGGQFTLLEAGEIFLVPTNARCVGVNRAVHEMGHVLGLGHSPAGYNDVMFSREIACAQNISQVTTDAIRELYKTPAAADLFLANVSAVKKGTLLDINFTVRNIGLVESPDVSISFTGDGKEIGSLSTPGFATVPRIKPGSGITNRITNAKVPGDLSQLVVSVDGENVVPEILENNNGARVTFAK